jgi:heptosyltransferase-2
MICAIKKYMEVDIDIVVNHKCSSLIEDYPYIKQTHILYKKVSFLWSIIKKIRKQRYDIIISPHSSFRSGLISFLSGAKIRIGFKRNFQKYFLTNSIKHPKNIHKIIKNLMLLNLITEMKDIAFTYPKIDEPYLFFTTTEKSRGNGLLKQLKGKIIVIAPGSVWLTKRWQIQNYLETTKQLIEIGYNVVLSGSLAEQDLCNYIYKNMNEKSKILNICGVCSIKETTAVIEKADLVICNDSGTLHLANAVNTPVFAFFGPTVKSIGYFPYREKDYVFEKDIKCRPCGSHGAMKCPKKHFACMNKISVEEVVGKVKEFLLL